MNSANADERRGELSLACILALDVQLVRATITRGSGPICSRVGAPPRMSSMPQPHLVRCVIRDTPARRARLHDPRVPTAGDLLVTTPTNTDRTPYMCTLVLPCRPSRPEPALLLPQARQPRHTAPWRVPRVHTHNSHAHTNLYHAKLSSNKHPLSLTWRLSRPTIALVLQGRRGAPSPSFRGKKGQCVHTRRTRSIAHCFDSAPAGLILRPCCSCHRLPRCVHRRHRLHWCAACRCRQRRAAHPHGACAPCSTPAGAPPTAP